MKVVINRKYGGFGLSHAAYEKLIEYGIPVRAYTEQTRDAATGLCKPEPRNDGECIFDGDLNPDRSEGSEALRRLRGSRYWDTFLERNRSHPLLVRVVEELGEAAGNRFASLKVVEIPDGIEWEIDDYDGMEKVVELHRSWS